MSSKDLGREVFPLKADSGLRSCLNRRERTVYNQGTADSQVTQSSMPGDTIPECREVSP